MSSQDTHELYAVSQDAELLAHILKNAAYSTRDMTSSGGIDDYRQKTLMRRISTNMIALETYPLSKKRRSLAERAQLNAWENEGGTISRSRKRKT
jgi:hypothetical protein